MGRSSNGDGLDVKRYTSPAPVREPLADDSATRLLLAWQAGHHPAFDRLYEITRPRLKFVAWRILHDSATAEDVLQDSFVTIWRRASAFRPERASAMTWMSAIVRHRSFDRLERIAVFQGLREVDDRVASLADTRPGPDQLLILAEGEARVSRALARLPGQYRQALTLAYRFDFSHSEVAGHLGVPLGTAKSWVRRGLEGVARQWNS